MKRWQAWSVLIFGFFLLDCVDLVPLGADHLTFWVGAVLKLSIALVGVWLLWVGFRWQVTADFIETSARNGGATFITVDFDRHGRVREILRRRND